MKRKNALKNVLVIVPLCIVIVALWRYLPSGNLLAGAALQNSQVMSEDHTGFPLTITDPTGQAFTLHKPPERIVSAILAGDEMLTQLISVDKVSSVTRLVDDAEISNATDFYPKKIYRNDAKIEELLAMQPDLVLIAGYSDAVLVRLLISTGIPVLRFSEYDSYEDLANNTRILAKVLGAEDKAETWVRRMWQRINTVEHAVEGELRPRVLFYSMTGSAAGFNTLTDETIGYAGGFNVIRDTQIEGYIKISPELAISLQPDVILLSAWQSDEEGADPVQLLLKNPAWRNVPAIKNQRVYSISGAWITSVTPFRVNGVEEVARLLHLSRFMERI